MDLKNLPPKLEIYRQTNTRVNWDNPTREEMVKSLNDAHSANRAMVIALDQTRMLLVQERERARNWRNLLLGALAATWTVLGFMLKFLLPWAIKGMVK